MRRCRPAPRTRGDSDGDEIHLFEQEEQELLEIALVLPRNVTPGRTQASDDNDSIRNDAAPILRLRQYPSTSEQWGIHSSVWDGGIALLYYVAAHWDPVVEQILAGQQQQRSPCNEGATPMSQNRDSRPYIIDLGAGTGVTGLGLAAWTRGRCAVALTDQDNALPLLRDNVARNATLWNGRHTDVHGVDIHRDDPLYTQNTAPAVYELAWGTPADALAQWLPTFLKLDHYEAMDDSASIHRRVLITGADIVYKPLLFEPLLTTIVDLHIQLMATAAGHTTVEIWLSCQSVRAYLDDFWRAARQHGLEPQLLSIVTLDERCPTTLGGVVVENAVDSTLPPQPSRLAKGHGINWIVSLTMV
jgi:Lysine methyltransferase